MKKKILKTYALILIIVVIVCGIVFLSFNKPSITQATYEELTEVYGIGDTRAQDIIYYCDANKNASVGDLDYITGIGDKTVDILKERWK